MKNDLNIIFYPGDEITFTIEVHDFESAIITQALVCAIYKLNTTLSYGKKSICKDS